MDRKNWFSANEIAMNNQSAAFPFAGLKQYYMGDKSDYVLLRNDPAVIAAVGGAFSDVAEFGIFDTDWFNVIFGNIQSQNHSLSISGASKNTNYLVSLGYNDQSSPLKWGKMNDARYNGRVNLETKLTKNFTSRSKISYERENYTEPSTVDGVIGSVWGQQPGMPYQTIDGKPYAWGGQGALNWMLEKGGDYKKHYSRINLVQAFDYNPIQTERDNLTITGQIGINDWNYRDDKFTQPVNYYDYSGKLLVRTAPSKDQTTMTRNWDTRLYQSYQLFANYKTKFLKNDDVNVMLGTSYETDRKDYIAAYRKNLSVAGLATLNIGDPASATNSDRTEQWGIASYFGRLNYAFKGKYLLEGNFRYDGSSRFTPSNRWGIFGGGSAAWRISEESFLKNSSIFQDLKLRASYGTTGNQEGIGLYDYVSRLGVSSYPFGVTATNYQTTTPGGLVSLDRTWETLGITNLGLDFGILNNKLSGSVDIFKKKNDGMLIGITYPSVLGGGAPSTNSGTVETKGYEITLTWRDKIGKDFSYNITAAFSDNTSLMTYLGGPAVLGRGIKSFVQGYAPYTIFGYKTEGIIQNETELAEIKTRFSKGGLPSNWGVGCVKIIDKNGDGILSEGGDVYDLGSTEPRYGFSLNLGMRWKGLDFSAFLQGYGKVIGYSQRSAEAFDAWYINQSSYYIGKSALVGDDPSNPGHKIVLNPEAKYALTGIQTSLNYLYNDLSANDYGYVRLKQISLGYTIPEKWCNKIKIQGLRVFVSGNDVWEWVKRNDGFDPESDWRNAQSNNYPAMRSWSLGVNLNF
jgi:TonB-linked SusC/RagA family outer membrane protein